MSAVALFVLLSVAVGALTKAPNMSSSPSGLANSKGDNRSQLDPKAAVATREKAVWCHREYVSAKDCDKWVADQLARQAARTADEERRREERRADEDARRAARKADEKRRQDEQHVHAGLLMMLAAPPGGDQNTTSDTLNSSQAANAAKEKAAWCHREYVSAKDCDKWVADQLARQAARTADEERRREERRTDGDARRAARKADEEWRQDEQHVPAGLLMMLAASPGGDQNTTADAQNSGQAANAAKEKAAWCHREYVSATDCDKWVADQLARQAARTADEKRRREERRADEDARRAARKADEKRWQDEQHVPAGLVMMLAASPGGDQNTTADAQNSSQAANAAKEKAAWCHREYVSAKDCDKWVADQLARQAARTADEARRREERRADEDARRAARKADEKRLQEERHAREAKPPHDPQHEPIVGSGSASARVMHQGSDSSTAPTGVAALPSYGGDRSLFVVAACSAALAVSVAAHATQLVCRGRYVRQGPALLTDAAPV